MQHQGQPLFALVADDPATAMDLEQHRSTLRDITAVEDVEPTAAAVFRRIDEVGDLHDIGMLEAERLDELTPRRAHLTRVRAILKTLDPLLAKAVDQRRVEHAARPLAGADDRRQAGHRRRVEQERRSILAAYAVSGDVCGRARNSDCDVVRSELRREPGGEEARNHERAVALRPQRVCSERSAEDRQLPETVRHMPSVPGKPERPLWGAAPSIDPGLGWPP